MGKSSFVGKAIIELGSITSPSSVTFISSNAKKLSAPMPSTWFKSASSALMCSLIMLPNSLSAK